MIAVESRKCTETSAGFSFVSTTMPPITAWAQTPMGRIADSHTRSIRPAAPAAFCCRCHRKKAMNVSPAIATSGKLSSRLPNSIHELSSVWPELSAATALDLVHAGQSGQPSPDEESRTAAPVAMTTALEIIAASAHPCSDRTVGRNTGSVRRESTRTIVTLRSLRPGRTHSVRVALGLGQIPARHVRAP